MNRDEFLVMFSKLLDKIKVPDTAKGAHDVVEITCRAQGWKVTREYSVPNRGDGRRGKLDLLINVNNFRIGIEIDNKVPRKKSLYKLRNNQFDVRIILLRSGNYNQSHQNIDLIKELQLK